MAPTAVTFDFWNTLYTHDLSGENPVTELRRNALTAALNECGVDPSPDEVRQAYRSGFDAYVEAWRSGRQFGAVDHTLHIFAIFGVTPRDGIVGRTATRLEDLGLRALIGPLPGARRVLAKLHARGVKIGLISDTGLTPGRVVRTFLERDGFLPFFSALTFSDETGYPKPEPRMFLATLDALGAAPEGAAHIGDTPHTDIAGAKGVGMGSIRFAGVSDVEEPPEADAVVRSYEELPVLLR